LNSNKDAAKNAIANDRTTTTNSVNSYFNAVTNLETANGGVTAINNQIVTYRGQVDQCTTSNNQTKILYDQTIASIAALEKQIADLYAAKDGYTNKINDCTLKTTAANDSIAALELQKTTVNLATLESDKSTSLAAANTAAGLLGADCYSCQSAKDIVTKIAANDKAGALTAINAVN